MSLTWLSGDTVVLVLSNLSALETCRLMRVSTPLREVCSRDGVWKQLSHKAHPHPHSKAGPRRSYGFRLQFKKAARRVWEREWRRARQELAMIELPLSSQMQALNAATQALELAEQSVDKADWLGERVQGWVPRGVETTRHGIQALKAKRDDAKKHMVKVESQLAARKSRRDALQREVDRLFQKLRLFDTTRFGTQYKSQRKHAL
eukprot:TRINITY_DN11280_c0_g1_i2.p1 TRINITY_DN11280_c0_g1~~TRINITY_DN11280_c0_g1_i2.p1  ORF type:complete len:205 (+),score=49.65 TRINITY_DN11280_c0_g1_i2:269-883(+)